MTREEAAKILDPETTLDAYAKISYYGGFEGENVWQDAVNEACRMGAEALRALDAQEKQESFGEWISVKDKMPEPSRYVACIAKRNPFSRFMPMVARIEKNGWANPITEQYISEVTHWLPLPEPPKEEKR